MSKKMEEIKKLINNPKIKCISFDIFDTLVVRPCLYPEDIFVLIGKIIGIDMFKQRRIQASKRAFLFRDFQTNVVDIDMIYKSLQIMFNLSEDETERIKNIEKNMELDICYQRSSVYKLYKYALESGKRVIITSDMYYHNDFIIEILKRCDIDGFNNLYVSCECNADKRSGQLYDLIINDLSKDGIYPANILHIGDNKNTDIAVAQSKGIQTFHIPATSSLFLQKKQYRNIKSFEHGIYESTNNLFLGLLANFIFDDPFVEFNPGTFFNGKTEILGYYVAPLILTYCLWLQNELKKDNVETLALAWRDGYMIEKVFNIFKDTPDFYIPEFKRLYLGRAIRYPFYSSEKGGLFDECIRLYVDENMSVRQFINKRLLLQDEADIKKALNIFAKYGYKSQFENMGHRNNYLWFLFELEDLYKKGSTDRIKVVKRHIMDVFDANKKTAIFDVGYRASIGKFLENKCHMYADTYHIAMTPGNCEKYDTQKRAVKSYVEYGKETINRTAGYLHMFFEVIISEQCPSVQGLKWTGNSVTPIFDENFCEDKNIFEIQTTALRYCKKFSELFGGYVKYIDYDPYLFFNMITQLLIAPTRVDASVIKNFEISGNILSDEQTSFERWYSVKFK